MASKGDTFSIADVHVDVLEKIGGAGECLGLGFSGNGIKFPQCRWWVAANGKLSIICGYDKIGVVTETATAKQIVKLL